MHSSGHHRTANTDTWRLWHTEGLNVGRTQGDSTLRVKIVSSCSWDSRGGEPRTAGDGIDQGSQDQQRYLCGRSSELRELHCPSAATSAATVKRKDRQCFTVDF